VRAAKLVIDKLEIFPDRIEITSYGGLQEGLNQEACLVFKN